MSARATISVVIPCYNAERWLGEAITSCLKQTLLPSEIIVVDDGSTDASRAVAAWFGKAICLIAQDNRGGCAARNAGTAVATGRYIQYLDADDIITPHKLAEQVAALEETGADAVYGDWRHQFHEPDRTMRLDAVHVSGAQQDVLEALLGGWWVSPAALLFRRTIVDAVGGWDESLPAAQDRDFFTQVAMASRKIIYRRGCGAIYRRYGAVTVSTSNMKRWAFSHLNVLEKTEAMLIEQGRLNDVYRASLCRSYFSLARSIALFDLATARRLATHVRVLQPNFAPTGSALYALSYRLFGFGGAEGIARLKRRAFRPGAFAEHGRATADSMNTEQDAGKY
jgi:hypothetical protein